MDSSGFYALKDYFQDSFGTLSATHCASTFHVRKQTTSEAQMLQMRAFLDKERSQNNVLLGEEDVFKDTDTAMTLVAVDMNDPSKGPLGEIASYITVELFISKRDQRTKFVYIGNTYTAKKYQRLGLSVLLRFFFLKMALELKDVMNLKGIGSYTMVPESTALMVHKLGFHKWESKDGASGEKYQNMLDIADEFGNYIDTFLILTHARDVERLKEVVEKQIKLMGSCMLTFQKVSSMVSSRIGLKCYNDCGMDAEYESEGKEEYFCDESCQRAYYKKR